MCFVFANQLQKTQLPKWKHKTGALKIDGLFSNIILITLFKIFENKYK